jgi:hypothetical protein
MKPDAPMPDPSRCPVCGAVKNDPNDRTVDWDLVRWRTAFRAAVDANDAKIMTLLLELRAESKVRGSPP